jgi:hypothetical protein
MYRMCQEVCPGATSEYGGRTVPCGDPGTVTGRGLEVKRGKLAGIAKEEFCASSPAPRSTRRIIRDFLSDS